MKLIIVLTLLALSQARVIESECDVISIHNINYEKEVLKENLDSPYQMTIDYDTNTLFFSYTAPPGEGDAFKSAYINLKTNEYNTIPGISSGFAAAVDKLNQIVYLGGNDGIYQYDPTTHKAKYIDQYDGGKNIWQLFFKDKLFYTSYPEEKVYTFENGVSTLVPELKNTNSLLVAVDGKDNLFFKNSSGLFYYRKEKRVTKFVGDYTINSFTLDINDNLYFSTPNGFYSIDNNQKINKLAHVDDVYGLVVEGDNNFIYASIDGIIRLKPSKKICYTNEKDRTDVKLV